MRLEKNERFVLPGLGIVTVLDVYTDFDPSVGVPETFLELAAPLGRQHRYPAELARRRGRDLMSRSTAREVLSILANRLAPITPMQAKIRYRRAEKALSGRDPVEMAKTLRELMVRAQGLGDAPINIPPQEKSYVRLLTAALCEEISAALDLPAEGYGDIDCEGALAQMAVRLNPAPSRAAVGRYVNIYTEFPTDRLSAELRMIERTVRKKATMNDTDRRSDLQSRQHALLHIVDSRSKRRTR